MAWESLRSHIRESCMNTIFVCKHGCGRGFIRHQMLNHEGECGKAVVRCDCGKELTRESAEAHKDTVCPLTPVPCAYCSSQGILRGQMESHLYECSGSVPMSEFCKLMSRMKKLEKLEREVKRRRVS